MDEDKVVFRKLQTSRRYDQGTVTFRARKGKLIDLGKLHESIWATRLSGGTRSGLVSLDVIAVGEVVTTGDETVLKVSGSDATFKLGTGPGEHAGELAKLKAKAGAGKVWKVTGRVDNYRGRWPTVLRTKPVNPRRLLVLSFEAAE